MVQKGLAVDLRVERKDRGVFGLERCVSGLGYKEYPAMEISAASHSRVSWEALAEPLSCLA